MKRDLEFAVTQSPIHKGSRAMPLYAITVAVAAILVGFWQTAESIVAIWIRSATFTHGFIVVPFCLWLAWRKRSEVATITAQPWWWGVLFVFAAGALWLVGSAANAQVVQQFALAFMLQAAIITIIGLRMAATLAFPLAFLLFAVPTGEFLLPTLINWTADFTVAALRFSGIPVYREANNFVIPSGAWSVVEACSGVRYLIASFMIGTIYAAIAYRSMRRRALFIAASIAVPIVANWIRAYLIVLIGHLSNNTLATGVDHLIYGWIFFGVVMLILFWAGSFWQESESMPSKQAQPHAFKASIDAGSPFQSYGAAMATIMAALIWQPVDAFADRGVATAFPTLSAIAGAHGWIPSAPVSDWKPLYGGYRADVQQSFEKEGRKVGLYIAYYRNQTKGQELVTSTNSLIKRGDWELYQIASAPEPIDWDGRNIAIDRADLMGRKGKIEVYTLYWIVGHVTSNDYIAKAWLAWQKLTGRGDDSALIAMYVAGSESMGSAREAVRQFTTDVSPMIDRALWLTRDGGR